MSLAKLNWIGMIIGAVIGGLMVWVTHCPGNTCPLTSRWYILVSAGAILGLLWQPTPPKPADLDTSESDIGQAELDEPDGYEGKNENN